MDLYADGFMLFTMQFGDGDKMTENESRYKMALEAIRCIVQGTTNDPKDEAIYDIATAGIKGVDDES